MNGTSIVTHFVSKIVQWLFNRLGINILLLIVLVIEIACIYPYYNERIYEAELYKNQTFQVTSEPEYVLASELQPGADYSNDNCYKVMVQVDNLYTKATSRYPSFYSDDNASVFCELAPFDYYSDIDSYDILDANTYFPAGTRVTMPYYIESDPVTGQTISFISSDDYYLDSHGNNAKNTLTITFP